MEKNTKNAQKNEEKKSEVEIKNMKKGRLQTSVKAGRWGYVGDAN